VNVTTSTTSIGNVRLVHGPRGLERPTATFGGWGPRIVNLS
jgi:hypothetical protein